MYDRGHPPPQSRIAIADDRTPIAYDVYDSGSNYLALVVPGFWRDRKYPAIRDFCQTLRQAGYTSAALDLRGHGDSGGTYGFNLHEHLDVDAVARDLLHSDRRIQHIVLIGLSLGGAISVATAARHADLPLTALMLISPVARFRMIRPVIHPFSMHRHLSASQALKKPRFSWDFWRSTKLDALEDISRVQVPVTLVHVKRDWLIHHSHSEALFQAAHEPKELHLLEARGNYHADRIFSACAEEFDPLLRGFLERWVGVGAP